MKAVSTSSLPVMEHFLSLQGEGAHTGKLAYFIRLAGCTIGCHWCDVKESWDEKQHPRLEVATLCDIVTKSKAPIIVITGGEPLQHPLDSLTHALRIQGMATHLETSGAYPMSGSWNWICLSPKKRKLPHESVLMQASELKVVIYNRDDIRFAETYATRVAKDCRLFLQPEWSKRESVLPWLIAYLKDHPQWQLSLQTHKYISLP